MILTILRVLEVFFFIITSFSVGYLFFYAVLSMKENMPRHKEAKKKNKILVLFPAYNEDKIIINSIEEFIKQDYPRELFDVVIVSDNMKDETDNKIIELGGEILKANYDNSSKAKALKFAINQKKDIDYDIIVILDADNIVEPNFLNEINNAYYAGSKAIQAHRVAKNRDTEMAILDAVSEEINNSIFRRGHVRIGISSALIGSGMAFDYKWFKENVHHLNTAGEDKELEVLLLKQGIYIDFLNWVFVYDEKTRNQSTFAKQRRRWIAAQFSVLKSSIKDLPKAIWEKNWDYADKLIQWMMLPRIVVMGFAFCFAVGLLFIDWVWAIKWWIILIILMYSFAIAIPDFLVDKKLKKTFHKLPLIFVIMVFNIMRIKGVNKKYIHTKKGGK
ncbi:MAG: glycosyltransferase family 2 protein [Bacteroidales bacterium]|nr:glycosyltransferase family 2 protein [Bacteroidales bacterium]